MIIKRAKPRPPTAQELADDDLHELRVLLMEFGWDSTGEPVVWLRHQLDHLRLLKMLNRMRADRIIEEREARLSVEPNRTPALDAVGKPTTDTSGAITRDSKSSSSSSSILATQASPPTPDPMRECLEWIASQTNLFFAECSQAEEIIHRVKLALAASPPTQDAPCICNPAQDIWCGLHYSKRAASSLSDTGETPT